MLMKLDKLASLRRFIGIQHRSYSAQMSTEDIDDDITTQKKQRRKPNTQDSSNDSLKIAKDMRQHFSSVEKKFVLSSYPENLIRKKTKLPTGLYNTCPNIARVIVDEVKKDLPEDRPVLEANPGPGMITNLLLRETKNDLFLYEPDPFFHETLNQFPANYESRNITINKKDILAINRYALADFMDDGTRVSEMFRGINKKEFHEEPAGRAVVHTCSWSFLKHLLRSIMFQNSITISGRFEFYMVIPPLLWMQLTCSGEAGYFLYRTSSVLFQLFFDYELIRKFDKRDFLPWLSYRTGNKKEKYQKIDFESLYFVKFVPRQNLHHLCLPENLPALGYFISQNLTKRAARVIPQLEQWIPGCGPRLIINSKTGVNSKQLHEDLAIKSSVYHEPCREIITNESIENLNIFTEFGELTPMQIFAVFEQFINFPEFKECPFIALMETAMLKLQANAEDSDLLLEEKDEHIQDENKDEPLK